VCERVLANLEVAEEEAALMIAAAQVHDIGKIRIPREVIQKKSPLSRDEWALIERHPDRGAELVTVFKRFRGGTDMIRHHHERWDGCGYPCGLIGTEIPLGARIIAVADSFDAMIHDRPYRRAVTVEMAVKRIEEGRAGQWDPEVVDAFLLCMRERIYSLSQPERTL
jgi:HD-GYP domain-containing protein (c-di-GMP phosphodiesterase class II)